ncbi:hypothetical protein [Bacillus cereus]|uniref:hypothetical protein n=1 Tax=Bacillus cereus TaxID=1396 RepID=UPI000BFE7150|nr:hypothetical protein [Bacillus cereus]PGR73459.1 hypothetical protein COC63_29430 [Bacillus cereus]
MLSNQFTQNINYALSKNQYLDDDDFTILLPQDYSTPMVIQIYYTFNKDYYFKTTISSQLQFRCEFSPGQIMLHQPTISFKDEEEYFMEIENWVNRIQNEFNATPLAKLVIKNQTEVEELKQKVDTLFNQNQLDPNEQFTSKEAKEMEQKLEEFKMSIEEKLETELAQNTSLNYKVKKLNEEIEFLKNQMQALTKKNWFTAFSTKMIKFIKNNPETTKAITQTTKHLLPEGIKEIIPDDATNIVDTYIDEQIKS